jgi:hypothetical protein
VSNTPESADKATAATPAPGSMHGIGMLAFRACERLSMPE